MQRRANVSQKFRELGFSARHQDPSERKHSKGNRLPNVKKIVALNTGTIRRNTASAIAITMLAIAGRAIVEKNVPIRKGESL